MDKMSDMRESEHKRASSYLSAFSRFADVLNDLSQRFRPRWREKLGDLTLSQWFYLVAIITLLFVAEEGTDLETHSIVGIIAGIGLLRELWHLFQRVWQKMLGKGFFLVLYAATANFALAISALKINAIAGIEPTPFVFTLAFTTLLMLPFWLTVATALFCSVALIGLNFWLLISILLRLIGIKIKVHWEDTSFVFLTMLLRVILIPFVIAVLFNIVTPYAQQIELFDTPMQMLETSKSTELDGQESGEADGFELIITSGMQSTNAQQQNDAASATGEDILEIKPVRYLDTIVANFIYYFEAYPHSACIKTDKQRSLIIDENLMMVVEKDDSDIGFTFAVQACIPKFEQKAAQ